MKSLLMLLGLLPLFLSCSKEEYPRVEYRVNSTSSTAISYTMATNSLRQEIVSGSWKVSFRHAQGSGIFLSAINPLLGSTTISVYINKELKYTQSTQIPGALIQIEEVVP